MARKKRVWSKQQLEKLHECWMASKNRKECLVAVSERLPEMPPPVALALIRRLSRTDRNWQMTARRKEREREEERQAKERLKEERLRRRDQRKQIEESRERRREIGDTLCETHAERIAAEIGDDFFFCPDTRQQVSRLSCIFRAFGSQDKYGFAHNGPCSGCERMMAHAAALREITGDDDEGKAA